MISNLLIGVAGLLLAGDSIGRGIRESNIKILAIGVIEMMGGLYFIVAAIGS